MSEPQLTCSFCGEKIKLNTSWEQVQTEKHKTDKVNYDRLMVFRCPACKAAGIDTAKFGASIVKQTGVIVNLE